MIENTKNSFTTPLQSQMLMIAGVHPHEASFAYIKHIRTDGYSYPVLAKDASLLDYCDLQGNMMLPCFTLFDLIKAAGKRGIDVSVTPENVDRAIEEIIERIENAYHRE